ncbi:MAG: hypothetical protein ACYC27_07960 [Armatimonadota bacterium]
MRTIITILIFLVIAAPILAQNKADDMGSDNTIRRRVFKLSPGMKPMQNPNVHAYTDYIPDADGIPDSGTAIEPEQPYRWVHDMGKPFNLMVSGKSGSFILTCWNWENQPVAQTRFEGPFNARLRIDAQGRGTWVLTLDRYIDGAIKSRLVRSFSVCPPNNMKRKLWEKNGFWIGQVSVPGRQWFATQDGRTAAPPGLTQDESRNLDAELVARMGTQVSRIDLPVIRIDKEAMDLDFALTDLCIKAFTSRGLKMDLQLFVPFGDGMGPILPHYNTPYPWIYPIQEKPYRHYVKEVVKRYGKDAAFVQVNNEPDNPGMFGGTPSEFIEMMRTARDEIKKTDPRMPVTNGGYCQVDLDKTHAIVSGIKGYNDFVSYHCHGTLAMLKKEFAEIQRIHDAADYVNPKYAITEVGFFMPSVKLERMGAFTEMQKILYCWAHGNIGAMLYSSRELDSPRQHKTEYGFVDYFFCPRFTYGAVSAFIDHYAGVRFERIEEESDNLHVYLFKGKDRMMAAVFTAGEPVTVTLKSNAREISLVDPMGNVAESVNGSSIDLKTGSYPQTLIFHGASKVEMIR